MHLTLSPPSAPSRTTVLVPPEDTVRHDCRCGHLSLAHEHYRRGTDCAFCACPRFRGTLSLLRWRGVRHERHGAA